VYGDGLCHLPLQIWEASGHGGTTPGTGNGCRMTMGTPESTAPKQSPRWPKGRSGNPKGRPRGARNRATMAAEVLLDGQAEALTQVCIDRALRGDMVALRLCLERLVAPRKDRPVRVQLPSLHTPTDILVAMRAVIEAVRCGDLTPDEGERVTRVIEQARKAMEVVELDARLRAVEERIELEKPRRTFNDGHICDEAPQGGGQPSNPPHIL
jgi:hypothetical protein